MQFLPPKPKVEFAVGKPLECCEIFDRLNEKGFLKNTYISNSTFKAACTPHPESSRGVAQHSGTHSAGFPISQDHRKSTEKSVPHSLSGIYGELWALRPVKPHG